ncbi:PhnD/SsuA/transferrin family substrate-binding protein [Berryella wangjianweii]|uniref:PhnD/SsuA/transferrin family substrate-binding protein n=1 Tax=Berryella wangjianweii TaxID=2734634 RepID=A0A6M8J7Y3_9ACTN|nr:PhnD/SsuA/transferrin family substrate-binding protein [Berryella wangjianweii]NPD31908.1 PhnD/SsuA/transferrin family substrate-binding protein [Eggerthellaceae bacterium zg-997]QKF07499.1 PhnD/SsuA/transferrin family substrate-binding protein [Berryella wangjianweii]
MTTTTTLSRRSFMASAAALAALGLAGCGSQGGSSAAPSTEGADAPKPMKLKVGTLPTEDLLPLWVALSKGLAEGKVEFEVVPFQAATELIAGISSGAVDMAMTDPMVAASVTAGGTPLQLAWVTLGETAQQGRFGIMTSPKTGITSLSQLDGVPVGVGSNTILEYVMDRLMLDAGIPQSGIKVEEMQKLPVRFQAMMAGEVKAAALPGSLLALGEAKGCITLADDTAGDNISQSVMAVRQNVIESPAGAAAVEALTEVWDAAVALINADRESFRSVLLENANLSDAVKETYPISEYPMASKPTSAMVDPVLTWMRDKGYLTVGLRYDESTGKFIKE